MPDRSFDPADQEIHLLGDKGVELPGPAVAVAILAALIAAAALIGVVAVLLGATYRTYWFRIPDSLSDEVKTALVEAAQEPVDTDGRWMSAIDAIGKAGA